MRRDVWTGRVAIVSSPTPTLGRVPAVRSRVFVPVSMCSCLRPVAGAAVFGGDLFDAFTGPPHRAGHPRRLRRRFQLHRVDGLPAADAAINAAAAEAMNPVVQTVVTPAAAKNSSSPSAGKGKFTIQLVTYRTQAEADKLIDKLAAEGYRGFSMTQGSYRLVFVNDFETRSIASTTLAELKGKGLAPADAYVRNMPKLS